MARMAQAQSIESQIANYVSSLPDKKKKVVLTVVKTIAEDNYAAEFEKKWAEGGHTLEESRKIVLKHIDSLKWKK
ncbi:MAG: hypothetical protein KF900_07930 [Bacteroidetes bacterium]|nr:hypothetical protein [Bacteroidota bacterium]